MGTVALVFSPKEFLTASPKGVKAAGQADIPLKHLNPYNYYKGQASIMIIIEPEGYEQRLSTKHLTRDHPMENFSTGHLCS